MYRWPRMAVPDVAVHVIQRGNHRQPIFFATGDSDKFPRSRSLGRPLVFPALFSGICRIVKGF